MTTLSHPFFKHPDVVPVPEDKADDVEAIYQWILEQKNFPNFTRNHAHLFLFACLWDVKNTQAALTRFVQIRSGAPDVFSERDPCLESIQSVFNMSQMAAVSKLTPEGYRVIYYRLWDTNPAKIHFGNAIKAFCMFNDVRLSEDVIVDGYVVVFDMKGLKLGHLAKVQLGPLKTFMAYIQDAHPVRLKKIYIVHANSFINHVMSLLKPLIKTELMSLLQFVTEGPSAVLPVDVLPEDYGGPMPSFTSLHTEQRLQLETEYRDWLIDSANLIDPIKLKEQKEANNNKSENGKKSSNPVATFSRLEID